MIIIKYDYNFTNIWVKVILSNNSRIASAYLDTHYCWVFYQIQAHTLADTQVKVLTNYVNSKKSAQKINFYKVLIYLRY